MSTNRIASYKEFFPFYLREHSKKATRAFHYVGTLSALALFVGSIVTQTWWLIPFYLVIGYGFAWYSHFFIEHNKPATFTYPLWSLFSDFKMLFCFLTGRMGRELEKAGLTDAK